MKIKRGIQAGPQKVVLYGPEGIGKSTFAAQFPNPLFLDVEEGTRHMDVARVDPSPASWTALLETVKEFLREGPGDFGTLVLDTADWAEQMCVKHVCAKNQKEGVEDFSYGKGYTYVAEEFGRLLNLLSQVVSGGANVVVLAHAKMRKFEQPDELGAYDRWELKLSKQVAPLVKEWSDMLLFANYKTMVVTKGEGKNLKAKAQGQGKRVLYTTHHACWDAKNRHGLADELPLDFGQIAHCIPAGLAAPVPVPAPEAPTAAPAPMPAPEAPAAEPTPEAQAPEPEAPAQSQVPDRLAQLMYQSHVAEEEVRKVIGRLGHFPQNTPWSILEEQGYVDGYILPQWSYFVQAIESDPNWLPF